MRSRTRGFVLAVAGLVTLLVADGTAMSSAADAPAVVVDKADEAGALRPSDAVKIIADAEKARADAAVKIQARPAGVASQRTPDRPVALVDPQVPSAMDPAIDFANLPKAPSFEVVSTTVDVPDPGKGRNSAVGLPVQVGRARNSVLSIPGADPIAIGDPSDPVAPAKTKITSLGATDVASVAPLGAQGLAFTVDRADFAVGRSTVELSIDYSAWVKAFGPEWATRARIVRFPGCVLTDAKNPACTTVEVVPLSENDTKSAVMRAAVDVDDRSGTVGGPGRSIREQTTNPPPQWIYSVSTSIVGPNGDWGATSLSRSGAWSVTGNLGSFTWSYPVPLPPQVAGTAGPSLALSYDSASVDGMNSSKNTQGSDVALGWDLEGTGFIERRYRSCNDPLEGGSRPDLCWALDNAYLSFGGHSGRLIPIVAGSNEYRLQDDPGWRVVRRTGAPQSGTGTTDNDGEWWSVYDPNGTQYIFGYGAEPNSGQATSSTWTVPVTGNQGGEPCANTTCQQAWRWNLDRVIDAYGNVSTYYYYPDLNYYTNPLGGTFAYTAGGVLTAVGYGKQTPFESTSPPAAVDFVYANRPSSDMPTDMMCPTGVAPNCNLKPAPSFYSSRYLTTIKTRSKKPDGSYQQVDQIVLTQSYEGTNTVRLWLRQLQRQAGDPATGLTGAPPVRFDSATAPMGNLDLIGETGLYRITNIQDDMGADIRVFYNGRENSADVEATYEDCTDPTIHPLDWDPDGPGGNPPVPNVAGQVYADNGTLCFPSWTVNAAGNVGFRKFRKWVATAVDVRDNTAGGPATRTQYTYVRIDTNGRPLGWRKNADPIYPNQATYSVWRGFPVVKVSTGPITYTGFGYTQQSGFSPTTWTDTIYYTGMKGDLGIGGVAKNPMVVDTLGNSTDDFEQRGTREREVKKLASAGGSVLWLTLREWQHFATTDATATPYAAIVREGVTWERRYFNSGGWNELRTDRIWNQQNGRLERVGEDTDGNQADPIYRCTIISYAAEHFDEATTFYTWIADRPSQIELKSGSCNTGATEAKTTIAYNANMNPSTVTRYTSATGTVSTSATYDTYGRLLTSVDENLVTTTASYNPSTGSPTTMTITTPVPGAVTGQHQTIVTLDPRWGATVSVQDPSNNVTTAEYDVFGRRTKVRYPGTASPIWDVVYTYSFASGSGAGANGIPQILTTPAKVQTQTRQEALTYLSTWTFYDGLGRARESQKPTPDQTGTILAYTTYDGNGRAYLSNESMPIALTGQAGAALLTGSSTPGGGSTRTLYDALNRPTTVETRVIGIPQYSTTYAYDGSITTTTPPSTPTAPASPSTPTRQQVDMFGRLLYSDVFNDATNTYLSTSYAYTARNELSDIWDTENNHSVYTYDWVGRQLTANDPDQGASTFTYYPDGSLQDRVDARGSTAGRVQSLYDNLGRKIKELDASNNVLAEWQYDSVAVGNGRLARQCAPSCTNPTVDVEYTSYNAKGQLQSATYSVPSTWGFGNVNGTRSQFTFGYAYDEYGHQKQITYPAGGGLAAETVTTTFASTGYANQLTSPLSTYVNASQYHAAGNLYQRTMTTAPASGFALLRTFDYNAFNQLISTVTAYANTSLPVSQSDSFTYNNDGTIREIKDSTQGSSGIFQGQCFSYDATARLKRAFTGNAGSQSSCLAGPSSIGFNPYDESYGYSTSGNLTSKAAVAYQYNATTPTGCTSGTAALKPHAAKQAGPNTYGYDCAGQMVSRTVGGVNATLAWNQRGEVTSFTDPSGTTSDVYLPDGSRIMRQNPDGTRNLYLPGEELKTTLTGTGAAPVHRAGGAGVGYTSANNGAGGAASVALTKPSGAVTGDVLAAYLAVPDTTTGGVGAAPALRGTPTATNNGASGATTLSLTKPTAATTNDVLIGALSIPVSGSSATLEAETATLNGPITENMWCPCSNNSAVGGFDPGNNTHYIQWSYTAPTAGTYQLSFRYGAGDAAATRKLTVNGTTVNANLSFPFTSTWANWTTRAAVAVTLNAGANTIRLQTDTASGSTQWLNLDKLDITSGSGGITIAPPSGWTVIADNATTTVRTVAYRHVVAASETGPYSFGFSATVKAAGGITAYSGVDTANPIDGSATGATTTAGTAHTATSVTTTDINRTLVTIAGFATNTTATPPAGMGERIDQAAGTDAPTTAIETADVALTAAGATGAKTVTSAAATTSATITVALRPIASGGSTTTLEAESATLVPGGATGPTVETSWCPCSNNASVGNFSATDNTQYVQWSYTAPAAGSYQLKFRYSAGGGTATRKLTVNGTVIAANQSFPNTSAWTTWADLAPITVTLAAGVNTVRLQTDTASGTTQWLNLDKLDVTSTGGSSTPTTVTPPAGWTLAGQSVGAGLRTAAYTHTLAAGETGPFTFTLSASVKAAGTISAYTGVDTSTPVDVTGGSVNPAGTSHAIPSVTTTGANRLLVSVLGVATITTTDYTGTSETKRAEQAAASGTPTVTIADGDVALAVAGATGTKTVTTTNSAASAGLTVTLRPVATAGAVTANRTYTIAGAPVAMRTSTTSGSSSVSWLLDNQQGSIVGMVQADTGVAATINRYLPYGGRRGTDQLTATDRGYIGQTEDPSTALVYLNARYYDPNLARFVSVDSIGRRATPFTVGQLRNPQDLNSYSYGANDPIRFFDPSGTWKINWVKLAKVAVIAVAVVAISTTLTPAAGATILGSVGGRALVGAGAGAVAGFVTGVVNEFHDGNGFSYKRVAATTAAGAIGGAVTGAVGLAPGASEGTLAAGLRVVGGSALGGAANGAANSAISQELDHGSIDPLDVYGDLLQGAFVGAATGSLPLPKAVVSTSAVPQFGVAAIDNLVDTGGALRNWQDSISEAQEMNRRSNDTCLCFI